MAKTALVTGAASGIGKACSIRLAREGMAVGVLDLNLEGCEKVVAEIKAAGGKAIALQASVADRAQMTAAVTKLRQAFGPVTVLVNNAGMANFVPFEELTDAQWDKMMEVNLKGPFVVTQVVLPDMKAAKWGRIVNISSSSGQTGARRMAHYSASKGGVITFTRTLAQELGPLGITVNNIPPGSISTTIMFEASRNLMPRTPDEETRGIPMRRLGVPDDIAHACAWLVSEGASYVTGQTVGVNGGTVVT